MNLSSKGEILQSKRSMMQGSKTCVSLFSGVLGLEIGLHEAGFGTKLAIEGLMTIIILFGLAFYIIFSIIDVKALNIISDLIMVGFAIMSLVAFLQWNDSLWTSTADFGLPIFTIIAGLLGIGGAIQSGINLKK